MAKENRVKFDDYGAIPEGDARLVNVASSGPQRKLHVAAAAAFSKLRAAAKREGFDLRIASGWRPRLWATRAAYEAAMIRQYGSVARGQRYRAFKSPHETGLAFDIGSEGLAPNSATIGRQRREPVYAWLVANAHKYGVTPYNAEPWHWEVKVSNSVWTTGRSMPSWAPVRPKTTPKHGK